MTNNRLILNANKTDFTIIGTFRQRSKLSRFFPMLILNHSITPSDTVYNLGVTFDNDFNFRKHISLTNRSWFYHIRDLLRILAKLIATALITSRLDCCNSLRYSIASKHILKLQWVHSCLARVVTRTPRVSHSVPPLKYLHWLPVQSHIIFKLCTIAYQTLSSGELSYLYSMLSLTPVVRPPG
ncbi:hypothetical protein LSH36_443g03020 [Paralvinella palmiformis]|uniref:Uncharacterized protein n=1 Tax=Paralvinella palmiformis TaxID=53620 RepID=A0AAD9MZN8_9ANNE|nr:hypothetical protein LSH36_443g03020 [Paralvinella palmiformis]